MICIKNKIKIFFLFCFLLIYQRSLGQQEFLPFFRSNIKPIESYFNNILENNKYIIYCSKNKLLLYIQSDDTYFQLVFNGVQEYEKAINGSNEVNYILKSFDIMNKTKMESIFNKNNYVKGYSDSLLIESTQGLIDLTGLPTYFLYKDNINNTYSEYILSTIMKPVPMDYEIYKFFTSKLINIDLR